jgi:hypothetical protein
MNFCFSAEIHVFVHYGSTCTTFHFRRGPKCRFPLSFWQTLILFSSFDLCFHKVNSLPVLPCYFDASQCSRTDSRFARSQTQTHTDRCFFHVSSCNCQIGWQIYEFFSHSAAKLLGVAFVSGAKNSRVCYIYIYNRFTLNIMRALSGVPNLLMIIPIKPNAVLCLSLTPINRAGNFLWELQTRHELNTKLDRSDYNWPI